MTTSAHEMDVAMGPDVKGWWQRHRAPLGKWLGVGVIVTIVLLGLSVLHAELTHVRYHGVVARIAATPRAFLWQALALTAATYLVLPCYDLLALRYVGRKLGPGRAMFAAMIAFSISQTLGFPALTGGSVRYRLWSSWGMESGEIARAIGFNGLTFIAGMVVLNAGLLLTRPAEASTLLHVPVGVVVAAGAFLATLAIAYVVGTVVARGRTWHVGGHDIVTPSPGLALLQLVVPVVDWLCAAAVLFALLPDAGTPGFVAFASAFVLSQLAGLIAHVPGGVGVFDSIMLVVLRPYVPAEVVIGTLVTYRLVYYILPFALGTLTLTVREVWLRREHLGRVVSVAERVSSSLVPLVLSGATFAAGIVLLASGATPAVGSRLTFLDRLLPLGVIELSHFVASLVGAGLLVLAWGLRQRLDAAWHGTVALLGLGIAMSLVKGLDWEEASTLSLVLLVLLPARRRFTRRSALVAERMSREWLVAMTIVIAGAVFLGVFAFEHVEYRPDMWWSFTRHGDASRFLRASVGSTSLLMVLALTRLLRHAEATPATPPAEDLVRAARIAGDASHTASWLSVLGDKALMFSQDGTAMLMYGVEGRSWVALGDPIGPSAAAEELAWRFREEASAHGAWPVFYEVAADRLPLYIDLGLSFMKLGEEAVVPLAHFSLDGGSRRGLRRTVKDLTKLGATFEVIPVAQVPALMPELRRISAEWLSEKRTREKGFSLGRWDERYLSHFPMALVRVEGRIVAFANIWLGAPGSEVSVDLMRHTADAPRATMEYLFIEMMLWGQARGYRYFSLGMAPMAGLTDRALAPLWSRAGSYLFAHGERFYNFEGLRAWKEKFDPEWRPRYLASPGGINLPRIVANVATLISGGVTGIVAK